MLRDEIADDGGHTEQIELSLAGVSGDHIVMLRWPRPLCAFWKVTTSLPALRILEYSSKLRPAQASDLPRDQNQTSKSIQPRQPFCRLNFLLRNASDTLR